MLKPLSFLALLFVVTACAQKLPSDLSTDPQPNVPEGWVTDYAAAVEMAKQEGKPVFVKFTGSDWCGWCIRMDEEILETAAFQSYASENLVRVYADFPRGKPQTDALAEQNRTLAERFGIQGFPTVIVLDSSGQQIGQLGYMRGGPEPFLEALKALLAKR